MFEIVEVENVCDKTQWQCYSSPITQRDRQHANWHVYHNNRRGHSNWNARTSQQATDSNENSPRSFTAISCRRQCHRLLIRFDYYFNRKNDTQNAKRIARWATCNMAASTSTGNKSQPTKKHRQKTYRVERVTITRPMQRRQTQYHPTMHLLEDLTFFCSLKLSSIDLHRDATKTQTQPPIR